MIQVGVCKNRKGGQDILEAHYAYDVWGVCAAVELIADHVHYVYVIKASERGGTAIAVNSGGRPDLVGKVGSIISASIKQYISEMLQNFGQASVRDQSCGVAVAPRTAHSDASPASQSRDSKVLGWVSDCVAVCVALGSSKTARPCFAVKIFWNSGDSTL